MKYKNIYKTNAMNWMEALKIFNAERLVIDPTGKKWLIPKKDTPDYIKVKALMLKDTEEATPVAKPVAKTIKPVAKTVKPVAKPVAKTVKPVAKPAKTVADYNRASMLAIKKKQKRDEDAFDKAFNEAFP